MNDKRKIILPSKESVVKVLLDRSKKILEQIDAENIEDNSKQKL